MIRAGIVPDEYSNRLDTMRKKQGESSSKVIRFFKIMFGNDFWKVLPLPPKFAQSVKHLAGKEIQIEDSSGHRWAVTLSDIDGSLAFHKGWNQFFVDRDLKKGHLLIFEYVPGGHFNVYIFGHSAVEITDSDYVGPRRSKRVRSCPDPSSPYEPFLKTNVKPGENWNLKDEVGGYRARPPPDLPAVDMEDMISMINRDIERDGVEGRGILYDLSSFEMGTKSLAASVTGKIKANVDGDNIEMSVDCTNGANEHSSDVDRFEEALDVNKNTSHCHDNMGPPEMTPANCTDEIRVEKSKEPFNINAGPSSTGTKKVDVSMTSNSTDEIRVEKSQEPFDINAGPSSTGTKKVDVSMTANSTDEIRVEKSKEPFNINAGPSSTGLKKVDVSMNAGKNLAEKVPETKRYISRAAMKNDAKNKRDAMQMTGNRVENVNGDSGDDVADKFRTYQKTRKKAQEAILNTLNNRCEKENAAKRKYSEPPVRSEDLKTVFGKQPIKQEPAEPIGGVPIKQENDQMSKSKSDLPDEEAPTSDDEAGPSSNLTLFSAKVESKSYLELPVDFPQFHGRDRNRGKVVYMKDSSGRIWPMLNPKGKKWCTTAVVGNWSRFCEKNGVEIGDECRFQLENKKVGLFKVDVMPK